MRRSSVESQKSHEDELQEEIGMILIRCLYVPPRDSVDEWVTFMDGVREQAEDIIARRKEQTK